MKNKEKFFDELIDEVYEKGYTCDFIETHCDFECVGATQKDCDVCKEKFKKWLEQEYNPEPRLTHDEYVILKNIRKDFKWIARYRYDDGLLFYESKPRKYDYHWICKCGTSRYYSNLINHLFQFIKWEDEEPTSIKELLDEYEKYHEKNK